MFTPDGTATIKGLISLGKGLAISHSSLFFKSFFMNRGDKVVINSSSILDKYIDYINKHIVVATLSDTEYIKYKFQPKMLSLDLYGTTELWYLLLRINNLTSIVEFSKQKLKVFDLDIIETINEILILEDKNIQKNKSVIEIG